MTPRQRSHLRGLINTVASLSNGLSRDACTMEELQAAKDALYRYVCRLSWKKRGINA